MTIIPNLTFYSTFILYKDYFYFPLITFKIIMNVYSKIDIFYYQILDIWSNYNMYNFTRLF